jgi:serine phosphatase RsbU (regulator of sigma subunit)
MEGGTGVHGNARSQAANKRWDSARSQSLPLGTLHFLIRHRRKFTAMTDHQVRLSEPRSGAAVRTAASVLETHAVDAEINHMPTSSCYIQGSGMDPSELSRNAELRSLLQATLNAERRMRRLAEISEMLAETRLEWSKVLETVVTVIAQEVGDLCLLRLISADGMWLDPVAVSHRRVDRLAELHGAFPVGPIRVGEGLVGRMARTGEPVLIRNVTPEVVASALPPEYSEYLNHFGISSVAGVPLQANGVILGTLVVSRDADSPPLTPNDQLFLGELAHRAAVTVDNAQLHREAVDAQEELSRALDRERRIADELQKCFRARLPARIADYQLGHAYQPALEEARIGGDFYDVFPLASNRYGVLIGDVSGKGLEAAVVTVKARYYLRGYAARQLPPAEVVRLLNQVLYEDLQGEAFVTLFYGELSVQDHRLTYVTAGHELPLLLQPDGTVVPLDTTGPLVAVDPTLEYESREIELLPGSSLLCYTDGVTEARHQGKLLGMKRLSEWLAACGGLSGQALVDELLRELEAFARGYLADDVAVMLLQRQR